MSKSLFLLFFLISFSNFSLGQDRKKLNVSIGIGPNESSDISIRFQKNQIQYGLGFGTYFSQKRGTNRPEIFTGEFFYHFAGMAEFSTRRPWYLRNGLIFRNQNGNDIRTQTWFLNLRLGREFNLSKRTGLSLDGGIIARTRERTKIVGPNPPEDQVVEFPIDPSFGLNFFYSFF